MLTPGDSVPSATRYVDSSVFVFQKSTGEEKLLQRLFTTFPGGRPGIGLLLLRLTVAGMTAMQALTYVSDFHIPLQVFTGGFAVVLSILLAVGLFTPITTSVLGLGTLALHITGTTTFLVLVIIASIFLLGPGSFSCDSYVFGRREIIIPKRPDGPR